MGRPEAAIVARELCSPSGLLAMDQCLVTTMDASFISSMEGLTIDWCRVRTMTCGLARGRRFVHYSIRNTTLESYIMTSSSVLTVTGEHAIDVTGEHVVP